MQLLSRPIKTVLLSSILVIAVKPVWPAYQVILGAGEKRSGFNINAMIGLNQDYDFKTSNEVLLPNGVKKSKFIQYYLGVPVWGSSLSATKSDAGEYNQVSGNYLTD